jgi:hypothetical protein
LSDGGGVPRQKRGIKSWKSVAWSIDEVLLAFPTSYTVVPPAEVSFQCCCCAAAVFCSVCS